MSCPFCGLTLPLPATAHDADAGHFPAYDLDAPLFPHSPERGEFFRRACSCLRTQGVTANGDGTGGIFYIRLKDVHGDLPEEVSWRMIVSSGNFKSRAGVTFAIDSEKKVTGKASICEWYFDYHGESMIQVSLFNSAYAPEGDNDDGVPVRQPNVFERIASNVNGIGRCMDIANVFYRDDELDQEIELGELQPDGFRVMGSAKFPMRLGNIIQECIAPNAGDLPADPSPIEFFQAELPKKREDGSFLPTAKIQISEGITLELEMLIIPDSFMPSFPDGSSLLQAAVESAKVDLVTSLLSVRAQDRLLDAEKQCVLNEAIIADARTDNKYKLSELLMDCGDFHAEPLHLRNAVKHNNVNLVQFMFLIIL